MRFIKIDISFSSLIPCLILPTDDRENTERRTHQLPVTKSAICYDWLPKKVDSVSEKVDPIPKKVAGIDCALRSLSSPISPISIWFSMRPR